MKKLLIAAMMLLTSACNSHHQWMDKAVVGVVDGQKSLVMFYDRSREGVEYYRPQFASECPFNKVYATDSDSTTCLIRETRITQLDGYYHHIGSGEVLSTQKDRSTNHDFIEGIASPIHMSDNI